MVVSAVAGRGVAAAVAGARVMAQLETSQHWPAAIFAALFLHVCPLHAVLE